MPEHDGEAGRSGTVDRQQRGQDQEATDRELGTDNSHSMIKRWPDRGPEPLVSALCGRSGNELGDAALTRYIQTDEQEQYV